MTSRLDHGSDRKKARNVQDYWGYSPQLEAGKICVGMAHVVLVLQIAPLLGGSRRQLAGLNPHRNPDVAYEFRQSERFPACAAEIERGDAMTTQPGPSPGAYSSRVVAEDLASSEMGVSSSFTIRAT